MTILEIECFLAICQYKTASRAAKALYITQPSLSNRLKTLEREVGGALFYRHKGHREMTLTPAGKEFYTLALQYQDLVLKMQQVCQKAAKKLRLSSLNSLDTYLLPHVYEHFISLNPDIELELQNMDITQACKTLLSGDTDMAFTTGDRVEKGLIRIPVYHEPMRLVCPIECNYDQPVHREELPLKKEIYVEWSRNYSDWHRQTFGELHPQLTVAIMAHLKQFMEQNRSWSIVPLSVANGLINNNGFQIVTTAFPLPYREISIVTAEGQDKNPTIQAFYQCLKEYLTTKRELS